MARMKDTKWRCVSDEFPFSVELEGFKNCKHIFLFRISMSSSLDVEVLVLRSQLCFFVDDFFVESDSSSF